MRSRTSAPGRAGAWIIFGLCSAAIGLAAGRGASTSGETIVSTPVADGPWIPTDTYLDLHGPAAWRVPTSDYVAAPRSSGVGPPEPLGSVETARSEHAYVDVGRKR